MPLSDYIREANKETMSIALLEDAEGVRNLSDIVSVDSVDVIIIGQYDLSTSMGYPGEIDHPEVRQAVEKVIREAHAAGSGSFRSHSPPRPGKTEAPLGYGGSLHGFLYH
jgi:4-hydroxy-2-oxoheptanedioate aldolase